MATEKFDSVLLLQVTNYMFEIMMLGYLVSLITSSSSLNAKHVVNACADLLGINVSARSFRLSACRHGDQLFR